MEENFIDNKALGDRLKSLPKLLKAKSERAFALSIDADPSYFGKAGKGNGISEDYIDKIVQTYNINKDWLLYGRGEIKSLDKVQTGKNKGSLENDTPDALNAKYIALLEKNIQERDNQINNLQEELKKVRESLEIVLKNQSTMDATIQAALEEMVRQVAKEQSPVWLDNIYNVAAVIELENRKKDNRLQIGIQRNS